MDIPIISTYKLRYKKKHRVDSSVSVPKDPTKINRKMDRGWAEMITHFTLKRLKFEGTELANITIGKQRIQINYGFWELVGDKGYFIILPNQQLRFCRLKSESLSVITSCIESVIAEIRMVGGKK